MKDKFMGFEVSEYAKKNGYVDYGTLAKCFDAVLCNEMGKRLGDTMDLVHGTDYDEETDSFADVYQYFIIDNQGYELLKEYTDEIVYYDSELDIYVWGVTHYGTSWSYVLTDIKLEDQYVGAG